jgi:hypothetical protein
MTETMAAICVQCKVDAHRTPALPSSPLANTFLMQLTAHHQWELQHRLGLDLIASSIVEERWGAGFDPCETGVPGNLERSSEDDSRLLWR